MFLVFHPRKSITNRKSAAIHSACDQSEVTPFHLLPNKEDGYVLVVAMMMLLILTLIGALATKSTITELKISGNDKVHKQTFYQADGGTELAQHLMYHNAICQTTSGGFAGNSIGKNIFFSDSSFSNNTTTDDLFETVSDSTRTVAFYPDNTQDDDQRHTNIANTYKTVTNAGSGMAMISGYDGTGTSSVSSTSQEFSIVSQHIGLVNSESIVEVEWQISNSVLSSASKFDCQY